MRGKKKHILIIDDEPKILNILQDILEHEGYRVSTAKSGEQGLKTIETTQIDLILLDLVMPGMDGMEVLKRIAKRDQLLPVLIISAHGNIPIAIEAVQQGAIDFIEKPIEMKNLLKRVENNLDEYHQKRQRHHRIEETFDRYGMIGISSQMDEIYNRIDQAAPINVRILITGETGTGKELVARAIHRLSQRSDRPFV